MPFVKSFVHTSTNWAGQTVQDLAKSISVARLQSITDELARLSAAGGGSFTSEDWSATESVSATPPVNTAVLTRWENNFAHIEADLTRIQSTFGEYITRSQTYTRDEVNGLIAAVDTSGEGPDITGLLQSSVAADTYLAIAVAERDYIRFANFPTAIGSAADVLTLTGSEINVGVGGDDAVTLAAYITANAPAATSVEGLLNEAAGDLLYRRLDTTITDVGDPTQVLSLRGSGINLQIGTTALTLGEYIRQEAPSGTTVTWSAVPASIVPASGSLSLGTNASLWLHGHFADLHTLRINDTPIANFLNSNVTVPDVNFTSVGSHILFDTVDTYNVGQSGTVQFVANTKASALVFSEPEGSVGHRPEHFYAKYMTPQVIQGVPWSDNSWRVEIEASKFQFSGIGTITHVETNWNNTSWAGAPIGSVDVSNLSFTGTVPWITQGDADGRYLRPGSISGITAINGRNPDTFLDAIPEGYQNQLQAHFDTRYLQSVPDRLTGILSINGTDWADVLADTGTAFNWEVAINHDITVDTDSAYSIGTATTMHSEIFSDRISTHEIGKPGTDRTTYITIYNGIRPPENTNINFGNPNRPFNMFWTNDLNIQRVLSFGSDGQINWTNYSNASGSTEPFARTVHSHAYAATSHDHSWSAFPANLVPSGSRELGSSSNPWVDGHITTLYATTLGAAISKIANAYVQVGHIDQLRVGVSGDHWGVATSLLPSASNLSLGSADHLWAQGHIGTLNADNINLAGEALSASGGSDFDIDALVNSVVPAAGYTALHVGSSSLPFQNAYFSGAVQVKNITFSGANNDIGASNNTADVVYSQQVRTNQLHAVGTDIRLYHNIVPQVTNQREMGTPDLEYARMYTRHLDSGTDQDLFIADGSTRNAILGSNLRPVTTNSVDIGYVDDATEANSRRIRTYYGHAITTGLSTLPLDIGDGSQQVQISAPALFKNGIQAESLTHRLAIGRVGTNGVDFGHSGATATNQFYGVSTFNQDVTFAEDVTVTGGIIAGTINGTDPTTIVTTATAELPSVTTIGTKTVSDLLTAVPEALTGITSINDTPIADYLAAGGSGGSGGGITTEVIGSWDLLTDQVKVRDALNADDDFYTSGSIPPPQAAVQLIVEAYSSNDTPLPITHPTHTTIAALRTAMSNGEWDAFAVRIIIGDPVITYTVLRDEEEEITGYENGTFAISEYTRTLVSAMQLADWGDRPTDNWYPDEIEFVMADWRSSDETDVGRNEFNFVVRLTETGLATESDFPEYVAAFTGQDIYAGTIGTDSSPEVNVAVGVEFIGIKFSQAPERIKIWEGSDLAPNTGTSHHDMDVEGTWTEGWDGAAVQAATNTYSRVEVLYNSAIEGDTDNDWFGEGEGRTVSDWSKFKGMMGRLIGQRSTETGGVSFTSVSPGNINFVWDVTNDRLRILGGTVGEGDTIEIWLEK